MRKIILYCLLTLSSLKAAAQSSASFSATIEFHSGSSLLVRDYKTNHQGLNSIINWINSTYLETLPKSHVHFVAHYKENSPASINEASVRASTLRAHLRLFGNKQLRYTFSLQHSPTPNRVDVYGLPTADSVACYNEIHYTLSDNPAQIKSSVARYPSSVFVAEGALTSTPPIPASIYFPPSLFPDLASDSMQNARQAEKIYFRLDKYNLDKLYMNNQQTLARIETMLGNSILQAEMDSIILSATASPEGHSNYNQRISERRLNTLTDYFTNTFPGIDASKLHRNALGEDWEGFYNRVKADPDVPHRMEAMLIARLPISLEEKEKRLRRLGGGKTYSYISKHILPYLRTGGTYLLYYPKRFDEIIFSSPADTKPALTILPYKKDTVLLPFPLPLATGAPGYEYIRPIAFKTNLLFDAATLFNVEVEVPIGKRFSVMGEWTFPFWGGLGNAGGVAPVPAYSERYTLQVLSAGLEGRYWFQRSRAMNARARRWGDYNGLNGWFAGFYGGAGLYDFQMKGKGMQGEFYIAAGISAGYAHPIAKYLHMEYSLGLGYIATRYYKYTALDGHKVVDIRSDGQYDRRQQSLLGPTKLKVSLVWMPRFRVRSKK